MCFKRVIFIIFLFFSIGIISYAQESGGGFEGSAIIQIKEDLIENLSGDFTATFQNTPVKDVFRIFALQSGLNIMVSPNLKGSVTANFTKVSIKDAFLAILSANNIYYLVQGNIVKILTAQEYKNELLRSYVTTKMYDASIIDVKNLPTVIRPMLSPGIGTFSIDNQSSKIIITDIKDNFERLDKLFKELASLPKLVEIETKIVKIDFSDEKQIGVNWSAMNIKGIGNISFTSITSNGVFNISGHYVDPDVTVDALISTVGRNNKTRTVSQPRVLAVNRQEANIHIGGKTPYIKSMIRSQTTSDVTSQVDFIDTGIKLTVTPMITPEDEVKMDIRGEVSSYKLVDITSTEKAPEITTTEFTCSPVVKDNQPIIIGGLITRNVTKQRIGIPLLMDIPILNFLFSYIVDRVENSELVIFIIPRVIKGGRSNISILTTSEDMIKETFITNTNQKKAQ